MVNTLVMSKNKKTVSSIRNDNSLFTPYLVQYARPKPLGDSKKNMEKYHVSTYVEHTKNTTLTLNPTVLDFLHLIVVRKPNPKQKILH